MSPGPSSTHKSQTVEMDAPARLLLAAQCALPLLPEAIRLRVAPLLTLESMAVLAGSVLILAASHAIGIGFAVDVVMGATLVAVAGSEALEAGQRLVKFHRLAMEARSPQDFEAAGRELAVVVSAAGVTVVTALLLKRASGRVPVERRLRAETLRAGWMPFISRLTFRVPRDKGMLWSKLGDWSTAKRIARQRNLVTLETQLEAQGFFPLYEAQFGSYTQTKAAGLEAVTEEIWRVLSRQFASSLEGKVTALVHQRKLAQSLMHKEPFIVDELEEIAALMQRNPNITSVELIDVATNRTWHMLRSEVLRAATVTH